MIWSRLFPSVRRRERQRFLFFFTLTCILVFGQTMGLVGAESLLLSHLGADILPWVFLAASIFTVLGCLVYAFGVNQARNDNYFISILILLAATIGVCTWGLGFPGVIKKSCLVLLFCLYYTGFAICTNHFWTFATDFFDSLSAKRLFPIFAIGASLGGMLGGGLASLIAGRPHGAEELLWGWLAATLLAAWWIRIHRRALRRSGPLEIEEADESSMEGMKSSLKFLRSSRLGRLLTLSSILMVTSLFVLQYLYSAVFVEQFPNPNELAKFFGIFLALANGLEVLLEIFVTPWLLRRFGIAHANLALPLLTLASFAVLGFVPGLPAAIFARLNRETFENAVGAPIRNLLFNALPSRLRGRMRAFLEGVVVYSGMALAGLFLLLWDQVHPALEYGVSPMLCAGGFALSLGYLVTNYRLKADYLTQLVQALREGRIEPAQTLSALEGLPSARVIELWNDLLSQPVQPSIVKTLATALQERNLTKALLEATEHNDSKVRLIVLEALHATAKEGVKQVLLRALKDPEPEVRLLALEKLGTQASEQAAQMLEDLDPRVRSEAARLTEPPNLNTFTEMLISSDPEVRTAALSRLPEELLNRAETALYSDDPDLAKAALHAMTRAGRSPKLEVLRTLYHQDQSSSLRLTVLEALPIAPEEIDLDKLNFLAEGLADRERTVRQVAGSRLAQSGSLGRTVLLNSISSVNQRRAASAIAALSELPGLDLKSALSQESIRRAREAWRFTLEAHHLEKEPPEVGSLATVHSFLVLALQDAADRNQHISFRLLEALEEVKVVRSVEKVLRFAAARIRADALEVLSNLGTRECTSVLVALLEEGDLDERHKSAHNSLPDPRPLPKLLAELQSSQDLWLQRAADTYSRLQLSEESPPRTNVPREEDLILMEHLLMLRSVPLFSSMTLEQLEAIHVCLVEQQFTEGETIFREGDIGDEMYIVLEGEVEILIRAEESEPLLLTTIGPGSYFGEMSILDDEPRSAAARVSKAARLLGLRGEQLKELVYVMPELAFTIFKVLSDRLRRSDRRLENLSRSLSASTQSPVDGS